MKKLTDEIHCINGIKYRVFQSRLKDVIYSIDVEEYGNPILWFAKELKGDWIVLGANTKQYTLACIYEDQEDNKGD